MSTAMPGIDQKLYFCLVCQKPTVMSAIQAGGHRGHILTEFESTQRESDSSNSLMRKFREKMQTARRYRDLLFRRHF